MGKASRFACIITPLALTLASLVCFVIVMLGQTPWKGNNAPATALGRELYFMKVCSFYTPQSPSCQSTHSDPANRLIRQI